MRRLGSESIYAKDYANRFGAFFNWDQIELERARRDATLAEIQPIIDEIHAAFAEQSIPRLNRVLADNGYSPLAGEVVQRVQAYMTIGPAENGGWSSFDGQSHPDGPVEYSCSLNNAGNFGEVKATLIKRARWIVTGFDFRPRK